MRVAVIDSGVHTQHPHVGSVAGGAGFDERGEMHADFVDRLGHGTAVAAAIHEKAPGAELHCLKVFDRELATTGAALVAACDYAGSLAVNLVNMSLGTDNSAHEPALVEAVRRLRDQKSVVIAAGDQDGVRWLPGALPGVWAVMLDWSVPRDRCRIERLSADSAVFRASGYPRPIPGVPPERNLKGLSFAVANVTGLIAQLLADDDGDPAAVVTRAFQRGVFA